MIPGVGPDAETVVNTAGAKQSHMPYRLDLLPPKAVLHVGAILCEGARKYGEWNWMGIPFQDHVNHALIHLMALSAGDDTDDHMGHAACRIMMALEKYIEWREKESAKPKRFGFAGSTP